MAEDKYGNFVTPMDAAMGRDNGPPPAKAGHWPNGKPMPAEALERAAMISVKLTADSGYECSQSARVSADQWSRICAILDES